MNKVEIILILILIFAGYYVLGEPTSVNIAGLSWDLDQENSYEDSFDETVQSEILASDLYLIENLKPRQQIYRVNDNATIDFNVKKQINEPCPYNLTVNWIYNDIIYEGWTNSANDSCNYYAYYVPYFQGEWKVQVILNWEYLNESYSKDEITSFEVFN